MTNITNLAAAEFNLEQSINELKQFEGSHSVEKVLHDLEESNVSFFPRVEILNNNQFNLTYDHRNKEVKLTTTYSNQEITTEFLMQAQKLTEVKRTLEKEIAEFIKASSEYKQ